MLYFLHGTDTIKSFEKSQKLVEVMLGKKPDASVFKLTSDQWNDAILQELVAGQGLFEQKYIVTLSHLLEDVQIVDSVLGMLKYIADSENIFIWTEGKVDSKVLQKIEKHAHKTEVHNAKEKPSQAEVTAFPLTDAIGARDKKKAWILFSNLTKKIPVEEIHGVVVWFFKSMVLSVKASAGDSGMKPFVYSKSKKFAQNFKIEELETLYFKLISMSHNARRGKGILFVELEKFILEL